MSESCRPLDAIFRIQEHDEGRGAIGGQNTLVSVVL